MSILRWCLNLLPVGARRRALREEWLPDDELLSEQPGATPRVSGCGEGGGG